MLDRGRASDALLDVLAISQSAATEYYTYATLDSARATARTAVLGKDAVLILQEDDGPIRFEPIPPDEAPQRLVLALPETPPAQVEAVACPPDALKAQVQGSKPETYAVEACWIADFLGQDRTAYGPLHATVRASPTKGWASWHPHAQWIDTEQGRVLLGYNADGWTTVTPGDDGTLVHYLTALAQLLRQAS